MARKETWLQSGRVAIGCGLTLLCFPILVALIYVIVSLTIGLI